MPAKRPSSPSTSVQGKSKYTNGKRAFDADNECCWANISPVLLHNLVATVTACGDAVMLTQTRTGGIAVTIYEGNNKVPVYSNDNADAEEKMQELLTSAENSLEEPTRNNLKRLLAQHYQ